jgi:hypothetical protein
VVPAAAATAPSTDTLQLLPAGADILRQDERAPWQPREVDTGGLALEGARVLVAEETPAPAAPDVSHLTVAEVGTDLAPRREAPSSPVQAPDFQVAATGENLAPPATPPAPAVDLAALSFDLAPAGSELDQRQPPPPPPAPDTSHLGLAGQD